MYNYIDLATAKSEALVNNTCKPKKMKSCNAKQETTMKMASRLIDLISIDLIVQNTFSSN